MIVVDEARSCIVGNVQLHLFTAPNGKPAVLARPNPTQKFLATQDIERLAEQLLGAVEEFANANNLEVYLPDQSDYQHLLSNREEFAGHIEELYFDKSYRRSIKLTSNLTVETIYKMKIIRKMPPPSR